ncbi:MAG TPA: hypothetical protein VHO48_01175 [Anaerolineaceae bacterium]|nr:hypothetical protein [Anaerolineaceae bacterium]
MVTMTNSTMDLLSRDDLLNLIGQTDQTSLSIFMPAERIGPAVQQNPIRLRNLLETAEEQLRARGMGTAEIRDFLAPVQNLLTDAAFWQRQSDGLAIFLSSNHFQVYRLPVSFDENVVINGHFYTKPLLPMLDGNGCFYLLALSQNAARLFEGDRFEMHEVDLGNTPTNMEKALGYDDDIGQVQLHTKTNPGGHGDRNAIFFGHGTTADERKKDDILRFFQILERGIHTRIGDSTQPLLLAGVEYLLPIYRNASRYPHIHEQSLTGNPENQSAEELHDEAWRIIAPRFQQTRREAIEGYYILANDGLGSRDIRQILPAAHIGQVDILLVARDRELWGKYKPETQSVIVHNHRHDGDEDLTEMACAQTLTNNGTVYVLEPEEMPDRSVIAATMRWPTKGMNYPG